MDQAVCCYRHPDRESGIRCTRCERTICPDCMVSASVGFHCPDCLREGQRTAPPPPRTIAGGRIAANPRLVTICLIVINVAVFVAQQVDKPLTLQASLLPPEIAGGEWYRLVTAMFLHLNPAHIGLNMLSLWFIGPAVEAAFGRSRYLALYLLSGLGGSALSFLLSPANVEGLGASGAIFGLLGALFVLVRRVRGNVGQIIGLIIANLVFSFAVPGIDWHAHIGGLVTGVLVTFGMVYAPRARRSLVQWGTCAAVLVLECVVIAVAAAQYTG
jgi:membrane associated rhomboid family serine protease